MLTVLFILLVAVAGGGYWQVTLLQQALTETRSELNQTRQQLQQITGEVSQTGASVSESDSNFRSELKVVNSEIRKLWDVSNKRNRQWINDNKATLEKYTRKLGEATQQAESAKRGADQLKGQFSEVEQLVKALTTEQLVANSDMTANLDALKRDIDQLRQEASQQKIQKQQQQLAKAQADLNKQLSALRSQVNLRLQQLENSVRSLGHPEGNGLDLQ